MPIPPRIGRCVYIAVLFIEVRDRAAILVLLSPAQMPSLVGGHMHPGWGRMFGRHPARLGV
jgi:hypothetical protein